MASETTSGLNCFNEKKKSLRELNYDNIDVTTIVVHAGSDGHPTSSAVRTSANNQISREKSITRAGRDDLIRYRRSREMARTVQRCRETDCVAGHEKPSTTLLRWEAANGTTLRLPRQSEVTAGQLVQWTIAPTAVRLPSLKPELYQPDNPVTGRVESRLNLGAYFQVALLCGKERLWLAAASDLVRHNGLETGREITVDLRGEALVCWQQTS